MTGSVLQINVSRGGIPKRPIPQGDLTQEGFAGDSWAHPKIHGGPDKAVLMIASEAIAELKELGFPVYPGALGENLTVEGLPYTEWHAGQRYRVGEAVIELTTVRLPCKTLNVYGPAIQKEIRGRTKGGFYARVLQPGVVFPGNPVRLMSALA